MADTTEIAWCDSTFNPWEGCQKVGPGCDNCYAEARNARFGGGEAPNWGPGAPRRRTSPANWRKPVQWNAETFVRCDACGWRGALADAGTSGACPACAAVDRYTPARRRVFCASLADVFDNAVDPAWRADLFDLIRRTPNLDWLLLTKRIGNVRPMVEEAAVATVGTGALNLWLTQWAMVRTAPPNVWLGATVVNQEEADRDIPKLLAVPARVRFLSMEPLLGPVNLVPYLHDIHLPVGQALHWVIVGGESGHGARPMHPDWARSLRDQCAAAGTAFLLKQWGEWLPWHQFSDSEVEDAPEQTRFDTREWVDAAWVDVGRPDVWASRDGDIDDMECVGRVGKKAAGRRLDGRVHNEFPEVTC